MPGKNNTLLEVNDVFDDFGIEFVDNLQSASVGTVSTLLSLELGRALGVDGFGAELLNTASSSVIAHLANNALDPAKTLFEGLSSGKEIFGDIIGTEGGVVGTAVAGFLRVSSWKTAQPSQTTPL